MFKKVTPKKFDNPLQVAAIQPAHCDPRVLHAPGECEFCDKLPQLQALRQIWGIAYTNYEPDAGELPCPANHARGDIVNKWAGNVARPLPARKPEDRPSREGTW